MRVQKYYVQAVAVLMVCYLTTVLLSACQQKPGKKVDLKNVQVHYRSIRFDRAVFSLDTNQLKATLDQLGNQHPDFAAIYFRELTGFSRTPDEQVFHASLRHFLTFKDYRNLYDSVRIKFPDLKEQDEALKQLFRYVKYYYPKSSYGSVYYFISGLNQWSAVTVDSLVGVGLDMYLGKQYPFYESVQLPFYQIERCEKEYIPVNVCRVIHEDLFPQDAEGKNLLDLMVMKGKQLYFMEHMLPETNDALLIGFTPQQLKWCEQNEGMIWNYFAKQKLLYSTQWQEMLRYVNDGPTSTGMPAESPGNIGSWIGWQIVRQYAEKFPEKTLQEIVADAGNGQQLMERARYKPKAGF